jgi:hypothetical protein
MYLLSCADVSLGPSVETEVSTDSWRSIVWTLEVEVTPVIYLFNLWIYFYSCESL